jgi:hypothetical protein
MNVEVAVEDEDGVEVMMNGEAQAKAKGASMTADQGLEAEARDEVAGEVGAENEGEGEVGRGENPTDDEETDCESFLR